MKIYLSILDTDVVVDVDGSLDVDADIERLRDLRRGFLTLTTWFQESL